VLALNLLLGIYFADVVSLCRDVGCQCSPATPLPLSKLFLIFILDPIVTREFLLPRTKPVHRFYFIYIRWEWLREIHRRCRTMSSNNLNGSGGRRQALSSVDFYRRVPKDLTEVRAARNDRWVDRSEPIFSSRHSPPLFFLWFGLTTTID
jgi:hypothetical protein